MLLLFCNLYLAMFTGQWINFTLSQLNNSVGPVMQKVINIITSIFNQSTAITDMTFSMSEVMVITAFVLGLITSIGIVIMAVKGVKKAFGIFFMGINRL